MDNDRIRRAVAVPIVTPTERRRVTAPALEKLKVKKKQPVPAFPPGLRLSNVRSAENIPDEYIKANFILDEHRGSKVIIEETVPLFSMILERLVGTEELRITSDDMYDEDGEELYTEDEHGRPINPNMQGREVKIKDLTTAIHDVISSSNIEILFQSAKLYSTPEVFRPRLIGNLYANGSEIILCKERIEYETDDVVLSRLKKKVFTQVQKFRREKERA
jgi:hypothetical protein